jgi:hypothetical protein
LRISLSGLSSPGDSITGSYRCGVYCIVITRKCPISDECCCSGVYNLRASAFRRRVACASPALPRRRFVVYRWCPASTAWIPHLRWLIAFGRRQTLRFRIQIKVLWPGTQKHKGLDSLVPFTCEKPAYRVLYLIASCRLLGLETSV